MANYLRNVYGCAELSARFIRHGDGAVWDETNEVVGGTESNPTVDFSDSVKAYSKNTIINGFSPEVPDKLPDGVWDVLYYASANPDAETPIYTATVWRQAGGVSRELV